MLVKHKTINMQNVILQLALFTAAFYLGKRFFKPSLDMILKGFGMNLMKLPPMVMMALMAIPEQLVMQAFAPNMPLAKRLSVSAAMYAIHFAWNGMVMKTKKTHHELAWILGTAYFAMQVLGVDKRTATALVAADSVMTLFLRDLV